MSSSFRATFLSVTVFLPFFLVRAFLPPSISSIYCQCFDLFEKNSCVTVSSSLFFFSWYKGNHVCDILTILFCSKLWNCMLDYVICCLYPTQLCITFFSFWLTGFHTRTDLYWAGICSGWCWVTVPDNSNKKLYVGCRQSSSFQALQLFLFIPV